MEIYLGSIFNVDHKVLYAMDVQVRIIDSNLGVLLPEVYMPIAEKTVQCKEIFNWTYKNSYSIMEKLENRYINFEYFIISCPLKVLMDTKLIELFISNTKEHSKFAFKISPDVLLSNNKTVIANLQKLRNNGCKIVLLNFGSEVFPVSKIINAPIDVVVLDSFLTKCIYGDENQQLYVKSISQMLKDLNIDILINNIKDEAQLDKANEYCSLASGKLFGNYKKDRYIRQ